MHMCASYPLLTPIYIGVAHPSGARSCTMRALSLCKEMDRRWNRYAASSDLALPVLLDSMPATIVKHCEGQLAPSSQHLHRQWNEIISVLQAHLI